MPNETIKLVRSILWPPNGAVGSNPKAPYQQQYSFACSLVIMCWWIALQSVVFCCLAMKQALYSKRASNHAITEQNRGSKRNKKQSRHSCMSFQHILKCVLLQLTWEPGVSKKHLTLNKTLFTKHWFSKGGVSSKSLINKRFGLYVQFGEKKTQQIGSAH